MEQNKFHDADDLKKISTNSNDITLVFISFNIRITSKHEHKVIFTTTLISSKYYLKSYSNMSLMICKFTLNWRPISKARTLLGALKPTKINF
jgi:hypothetical protein